MKRGIRTAYADGAYTGAGQVARLVEFDRMIAEVERAAAARALEEAADDPEFFAQFEEDRSDEFNEGVSHGADQLFGALRARAAEIREAGES